MKRIFFSLIWLGGFYYGGCIMLAAIAGGIAGAKDPANAQAAGAKAGPAAVAAGKLYVLAGAVVLAGLGAGTGFLPGTKPSEDDLELVE